MTRPVELSGRHSRITLAEDLRVLGLRSGDVVMVHAAMRSVGPVLGGVDTLVDALLDVVGDTGTLMAYTDWCADHLDLADEHGRVPAHLHAHVAPFDVRRSRANREYGVFPEWVRTHPDARRSANPGASVAAVGAHADVLTTDHPLDFGYGPGSPLARLVELGGRVLMVGAPWDTMTVLHHAEHLADVRDKRTVCSTVPIAAPDGTVTWYDFEEFDTADPVVDGLEETYFATVVTEFVAAHGVRPAPVGGAVGLLVPAGGIVDFGVRWIESHVG